MSNPFLKEPDAYERDFGILANYQRTAIQHIMKAHGASQEEAMDFLIKNLDVKDPEMRVFRRDPEQDRHKRKVTFLKYIDWVMDNKHTLAPNLIAYANSELCESTLANYVLGKLNKRTAIKKTGQEAEMRGDMDLADFCQLDQANCKFFNNSISGATGSPHNSLYYVTEHTTLTSTCRSCTSFANAVNEKLLSSNRHYYTEEVCLQNIADVTSRAPMELIKAVMLKYNLKYPDADYAFKICKDNLEKYELSTDGYRLVRQSINGLTPIELAAFCYVGDLNALRDLNDETVRKFYKEFMYRPIEPVQDPDKWVKSAMDDTRALAGVLNADYLTGRSVKQLKEEDPEMYGVYAAHLKSLSEVFVRYQDFTYAFICTSIMPANLYNVPTIRRQTVVASDTDSSIFTTENFVEWFTGTIDFTDTGINVSAITAFICSQSTANAMLQLSTNLGVRKDQIYRINMKSEFDMRVFITTTRTKHYMALIKAKEGNVFKKTKLDVKGVALKSSKLPKEIREASDSWYRELMERINNNVRLTPQQVMSLPAYVEHTILERLESGDPTFYRNAKIKPKDGYANPMSSDYLYYELWNDVFAQDLGTIEAPPVFGKKVSVNLTKNNMEDWLATLPAPMAVRFREWVLKTGKMNYKQIIVPVDACVDGKIPEIFRPIIDRNKLLQGLTEQFYIMLECFGISISNDKNTTFCSDHMTKQDAIDNMIVDVSF